MASGKYTYNISWAVADAMGQLIRGNKTVNTRPKGVGEEGGRGLIYTMLWSLWGSENGSVEGVVRDSIR